MYQALTELQGVGAKTAESLNRLGISVPWDVLFHMPSRYEDRTRLYTIRELKPGDRVLLRVEVIKARTQFGKRRSLLVDVSDGTGLLTCRFFHFHESQLKTLSKTGQMLQLFGDVRLSYTSGMEIVHPEYRVLLEDEAIELSDRLTPIYPIAKGVTQSLLRRLIQQMLKSIELAPSLELLPQPILHAVKLPSLVEALAFVHHPPKGVKLSDLMQGKHPAKQRLSFEELLAKRLVLLQLRDSLQRHRAPSICAEDAEPMIQQALRALPFSLTGAQQRVVKEIQKDLEKSHPMLRLVQGDVGAGKTLVAFLSMLNVVTSGAQAALMAPTELLVEQHVKNAKHFFEPLGISVASLVSSQKNAEREAQLARIAEGEAKIIVGTHALFQSQVRFHQLGLAVIDEQHRFGVHQRLALKEKGLFQGLYPHQLIMSATPIPRTLTMTQYADLDVSVIDELPKGRLPIQTVLIDVSRRKEVIARLHDHAKNNGQAYWVCTLIDESESLRAKAAETVYQQLRGALSDISIGLVHGRMHAKDKEEIMQRFSKGELSILVATTVIEVGVDVPNASLMIIENAERLGLSQLHQLRGRVGRGTTQSYCVLLYDTPLTNTATSRLGAMRETSDGFKIAEMDLTLRGPGEILGTEQAGEASYQCADLLRDAVLLPQIETAASALLSHYPTIVPRLIDRWVKAKVQYVSV